MQMTGSNKEAANSFFDSVNEYGERFRFRRVIDAGDFAMARLLEPEVLSDTEIELESDTLNVLLDEWCGDEGTIEMPAVYTFLFTDIVIMTASEEGLGMSNIQRTLRAHNRIVRTALERHSGREVKQTNNGIMATFGWTEKAIEAAQQIQQEIDLFSQANPDMAFKIRALEFTKEKRYTKKMTILVPLHKQRPEFARRHQPKRSGSAKTSYPPFREKTSDLNPAVHLS